jgi:PKD repeat protein
LSATPATGNVPLIVGFDAGASTDPDGSITRYDFDFNNDGVWDAYDSPPAVDWTYTTPGVYTAKVRVTDNSGAQAVAQLIIESNTAGNSLPVAEITAQPASGNAPLAVLLDASGSDDSEGGIVSYEWDFNGDGIYDGYGSSPQVLHTYTAPGIMEARVRVTDSNGAQAVNQVTVTVASLANSSPTAQLVLDPATGMVPLAVDLDASASADPDGSIVLYEWDFNGDGLWDGYGADPLVSHTYFDTGNLDARLRVTDNEGAQAIATATLALSDPNNLAPLAQFSASPSGGNAPLVVALDASASTDPDGSIVLYEWDFNGDGLYDAYGSQASASHTYSDPGLFEVKLRVTDNGGAQATTTAQVSVTLPGNLAPVAVLAITPGSGAAPLTALVNASTSSDPDGTIVNYEWDFNNDGLYDAYGSQASVNYTFTAPGAISVKVRVTDNDGSQDSTVAVVTVTGSPGGLPPTAALSASQTSFTTVPVTITLNPGGSADPDGSIIRYDWDWDNDGLYDASSYTSNPVNHIFTQLLVQTVTLRVTDNQNLFDTATVVINPNIPPVAALTLNPNPAGLGQTISVNASASTDPGGSITKYEFDLDANGSYETNNGTNPIASTSFALGGDFIVRVRVTDNDNNTATAQQTAQIRFADITAIAGTASSNDQIGFATIGGNPAISFYDITNGDLKYVRATNAAGSAWGPVVTIATTNNVGRGTDLVEANGRPAVIYRNSTTNRFYYLRADDATGSSWTPANQIELWNGGTSGADMEIIGGRPAVVFAVNSPTSLRYVRASNADGSAWNASQSVNAGGTNGGSTPALAEVNGMPAVAFFYWDSTAGIRYRRASNIDGTAWNTAINVASNASVNDSYDSPAISVVNGNPAVLYHYRVGDSACYKRGTDANGTAFGSEVVVKAGPQYASNTALIFIGSLPLAAYTDDDSNDLLISYGSNINGSAWAGSQLLDGGSSIAGDWVTMKVMGGKACLVYENSAGSANLSYARIF